MGRVLHAPSRPSRARKELIPSRQLPSVQHTPGIRHGSFDAVRDNGPDPPRTRGRRAVRVFGPGGARRELRSRCLRHQDPGDDRPVPKAEPDERLVDRRRKPLDPDRLPGHLPRCRGDPPARHLLAGRDLYLGFEDDPAGLGEDGPEGRDPVPGTGDAEDDVELARRDLGETEDRGLRAVREDCVGHREEGQAREEDPHRGASVRAVRTASSSTSTRYSPRSFS